MKNSYSDTSTVFTQPSSALESFSEESPYLCEKHLQEWRDSGVKDSITRPNVRSVTGEEVFEILYPRLDGKARLNAGRLSAPWMRRHDEATATSGYVITGRDPVTGEVMGEYCRYKPTEGTILDSEKQKPAKYLSPAKTTSRAICLQIDSETWQQISERYSVPIKDSDREKGFWPWAFKNNLPLVITEGEKKAGSLLSRGIPAISLPGIFSGFRKAEDGTRSLIPDLAHFDTPGRQITIAFDYEWNLTKAKRVEQAAITTAYCFRKARPKIAYLPGPQKGVDDFLVAGGNFEPVLKYAKSLSTLKNERAWRLNYKPNLELNQRYLGPVAIPESGLVCIKSPKGTGKTTALQEVVSKALGTGRKVLLLTHRIALGQGICNSIGLPYITEVKELEQGRVAGFGLCIDSCHPEGQGRIEPENWEGAIVIVDEAEQVIWHLLNSATCRQTRVKILKTFKALIAKVLSTGGLVIAQDADLSDYAVEFSQGCAGFPIQPWVCVNSWKPSQGWDVTYYEGQEGKKDNPSALLEAAVQEIQEGGRIVIACDAQKAKSTYGAKNIETYLKAKCPDAKFLRIDSETVGDPKHPAYNCAGTINEIVPRYDVIIFTPTLATGVSIDVRGHITGVYGIFQGAISENEVRQSLARVREDVPRHVWVKVRAVGEIGNGSDYYEKLAQSRQKDIKLNCRLLRDADFDLDKSHDAIALRTWAKQGARINISVWDFREQVKQGLIAEGHNITSSNATEPDTAAAMKDVKDAAWEEEAQAVAAAPDLTEEQFEALQEKRSRTEEERLAERKHYLKKTYSIEVLPVNHKLDQGGWHPQLQLHYYLTHDPRFLAMRDRKHLAGHIERGNGEVCAQDIRLLSLQVEMMRRLGILEFAESCRQWSKHSPEVKEVARDLWRCRQDIKNILGISVSRHLVEDNPIRLIQYLLGKMGIRLKSSQQRDEEGEREWVYQGWEYKSNLERHSPLRDRVFAAWKEQHEKDLNWLLIDEEAAAAKLAGLPAPITPPALTEKSAVTENIEPAPSPQLSHLSQPISPQKAETDPKTVSSLDTNLSQQDLIEEKKTTVTDPTPPQINRGPAKFADDEQLVGLPELNSTVVWLKSGINWVTIRQFLSDKLALIETLAGKFIEVGLDELQWADG